MESLKTKKISLADANHGLSHECYNVKDVEEVVRQLKGQFDFVEKTTGLPMHHLKSTVDEIFGVDN